MSEIRQTGKSVEDAIAIALEKLNALREQVDVQVITKGKKGFLGFGSSPAEVIITMLQDTSKEEEINEPAHIQNSKLQIQEEVNDQNNSERMERLENRPIPSGNSEELSSKVDVTVPTDEEIVAETSAYIQDVAREMGVTDLTVQAEMNGKVLNLQLESEKAAFLIGKRGATLNALQQLAQLVANKGNGSYKVVRLDVGDYRVRREKSLEQLAARMADKAVRSGKKVELEPMPSNERKVLHNALADRLDIETYSEGKDPRRYLVIEPIK